MEASYYWLISITIETVSVALVKRENPDSLIAIGPETEWLPDNPDSFLHSVDISLSAAADKALLEPEQEPESSAFILPPKWIGNDGKIFPEFLKLLENLCHSLKLKPLGFISNDEAFIESISKQDSFPPSFILVYLGKKEFSLSLIYLGEVKKRLSQVLTQDFSPQDLENALVTIQLESALPPRILVFGNLGSSIIDDLKNYSWIGKKNVETFLHLPDVIAYQPEELFNLYSHTVSSQTENNSQPSISENSDSSPPGKEDIAEESEQKNIEAEYIHGSDQVAPEDLGFSSITDSDSIILSPPASTPKSTFHFPKISLPKLRLPSLNFNPWFLFPISLFPLLILIPYFLIKAEVTINFYPVEINKDFSLTLDSTATSVTSTSIPVDKKTFDLNFTESIPTTGQKETGDKAKGEITVYNKIDKIQNISKGTILSDNSGKKYELLTSVQIPASSFNLATGTIVMGQSKANAIASDIGPEFNLNKDTILNFEENTNLLAKANDSFDGGSRRQIRVVSSDDKNKLNQNITDSLDARIAQKVDSEGADLNILKDTLYIDKKQLTYNREIGEEADTLEVNANLTISLFQIDTQKKESIVNTLLADDKAFLDSIASPSDFSFSFSASDTTSKKSSGKLTITGKSLPKINVDQLRNSLAGKSFDTALKIIDSQSGVYNRQLKIIPSIFSFLKRLPPSAEKITIISKF